MTSGRNDLIAALDVGSSKVCCFIARVDEAGGINITGIGHQVSGGMRSGVVVDMDAVEAAIRGAVDGAERMAGETVREAVVNLSGSRIESQTVSVQVAIDGHEVGEDDLRHALDEGRASRDTDRRKLVHVLPVGYAIDGARGIRDPRAMYGDKLAVDLHVVTADAGPTRNLEMCLARGHLGVEGFAASPYAAGLASLVEDEFELGATCIDMGGGTTSIAVFMGGTALHMAVVPIGGDHATKDIARGLVTTTRHAERIKTLHGSVLASPSDEREMVEVPQIGDASTRVPRSMLMGIIRPRIEEIFEIVRDRLISSGLYGIAGKRVVLTGGASQLGGLPEMASRMLDARVRLGRPIHVSGLAEATAGPAFSACAGLLTYALGRPRENGLGSVTGQRQRPMGRVARVGRWLKENF